jgi:protein involved in polysaccharide export with SLBB domain
LLYRVQIIGHTFVFAVLAALGLAGCASPYLESNLQAAPEVMRSSVRFQKEYVLYPGDQVEVLVWRNAEVSRSATIRPDGLISLPLLQDVQAAGLTPRELAQNLTKAFSNRLLNPEVTVLPTQVRPATVYVLGDVKGPGAFPARNAVTAAQAIALAGGVLRTGGEADATLIRLNDEGYLEAIPIGSFASWTQVGPYAKLASVMLKPDDIIFIPETGRAQLVRALQDVLVPYTIYLNYRLIQYTLDRSP